MGEEEDLLITATRLKRDASMMQLVNESQKSIQQLALLSEMEKRAVAFLMLAGQVLAVYSRSTMPDKKVLASVEQLLNSISPSMASRARSLNIQAMSEKENATTDVLAEASVLTHDTGILIESPSRSEGNVQAATRGANVRVSVDE